jgi:glycine cleavage system regulatory protein
MRTSLVLTIIGDDKPGIVEQLSDQILATGANWEESRMARLGGKFAGLLRLTVDRARADALTAELTRSEPVDSRSSSSRVVNRGRLVSHCSSRAARERSPGHRS